MTSSFIKAQGPLGNALDLSTVVDKSAYGARALDPVTGTDGKVYGAVYTGKVKPGFWYRPSFFAAHGLTKPTTWPQFTSLLSDIKNISTITNPIVSGDGVGWPLSDVTERPGAGRLCEPPRAVAGRGRLQRAPHVGLHCHPGMVERVVCPLLHGKLDHRDDASR